MHNIIYTNIKLEWCSGNNLCKIGFSSPDGNFTASPSGDLGQDPEIPMILQKQKQYEDEQRVKQQLRKVSSCTLALACNKSQKHDLMIDHGISMDYTNVVMIERF